jgi:lipopolysaccharide heptosyltransferase II
MQSLLERRLRIPPESRRSSRYRYVRLRWRMMFAVVDFLGAVAFGIARRAKRWLAGRQCDGLTTDPRVILVVQLDHLGDAILSTGMLSVLRRRYPEASIEVLAGAWNRELFEAMPDVDRVHVSRINRFSRTGRLGWAVATLWHGWRLRRRKADLAIDVRGEFPSAWILWLSGARRRLGWAAGGGGFLLTDSARFVPDRPEIASRRALLDVLGIPLADNEHLRPVFRTTREARERVRRRLASLSPTGPLVVMHVSAGTPAKQWPPGHWRELIGRLIVSRGVHVVLAGGMTDRMIARAILEGRTWPGVVDWTGRLGIVELAAMLEHATVLVGADSGPAHLAAAVGTPVVALFSGTNHAAQWQPRGERVAVLRHAVGCSPCHRERCPRPEHPCMSGLRPETVAAAVEALLASRPVPPVRDEIHQGVRR